LADLVRVSADLMGLRDWTFIVAHDRPADNVAEIDLHPERKIGRLRIQDIDEPEALRHAIAHELCHALTRDLLATVTDGVEGELAGAGLRVYLASVRREEERLADVLATILGPVLPLA
jgi:hypothetical protein